MEADEVLRKQISGLTELFDGEEFSGPRRQRCTISRRKKRVKPAGLAVSRARRRLIFPKK